MTVGYLSLGIAGTGAETAGGADTTLAADVAAGSLTIVVASATGIADNNYLRIGDVGEREIRRVAVGGVSGTTITLTAGLGRAHDAGDVVREVDDAGTAPAVVDLWDDEFSGFAYPPHKRVVPLLGSGTAAGNSVLMSGSLGYREASLSFTARDSVEMDAIRGYEETSETITFTDYDGSVRDVRILSFDASLVIADEWRVAVRLQELTEPV
jgi:hypothetical protein